MKKLLTGIKPTGQLTLGNYLGAILNIIELQQTLKDTEFFIFIADLHAITISQDRQQLRKNTKDIAAIYLAAGLDPSICNIFIQSEVPSHAEMGYIMESTAYIGEMKRMIQFKEKSKNQKEGIKTSLLTYPALMAADILLYDADYVPIGIDQMQHLELTKLLADRFNTTYGNTFVLPEGILSKTAKKIMSLTDPTRKMSKTEENSKGYILLLEDLNIIRKKIKSAVTDSDNKIYYDVENKPGISNLLSIYATIKKITIEDCVKFFENKNYGEFKEEVANTVVECLSNLQSRYKEIINSSYLDEILDKGAQRAYMISSRKVAKVYKKIGLGRK